MKRIVSCLGGCGRRLRTASDNDRQGRRCRKCFLKKRREWTSKNKDRIDSGKWAREHPIQRAAYWNAWAAKNHEKVKKYKRNYARRQKLKNKKLLAEVESICECGAVHTQAQRERVLRRMLPATAHDIREAWSCIWGPPDEDGAGSRKFYRDLKRIDAVRVGGTFYPFHEAKVAA